MNIRVGISFGMALVAGFLCAAESKPAKRFVAEDFTRRTIYHSPQTPGYTCWVGAWIMPDASIIVSFAQATGPIKDRPRAPKELREKFEILATHPGYDFYGLDLRNIYLRSADGGTNWSQFSSDSFVAVYPAVSQGGAQVLAEDGSVLRGIFGYFLADSAVPKTGCLERSVDSLKTWSKPKVLFDPAKYICRITRLRRLRDGRLIALGGVVRAGGSETRIGELMDRCEPLLAVSDDNGKSWTGPIDIIPPEIRKGMKEWGGEEWDAAELEDGSLMAVFRRNDPAHFRNGEVRWQAVLRKSGKSWATEKMGASPLRHSGHPELLATREGVILHFATEGIHWTADEGQTWTPVLFPGLSKDFRPPDSSESVRTRYYPKSIQTKDGRIYVFGHDGWDNQYGDVDQSIVMDTFRLTRK